MSVTNEFESDTHRRVCANLGQPRSVAELARFLHINDSYVEDTAYSIDGATSYLQDLEADGLVKQLGTFESAEALLEAVKADDALVTIKGAKAKSIVTRAAHPLRGPYLEDAQWLMTEAGLERLKAPAPNTPPPLEGDELARVEARNDEIAAEDAALAEENAPA